MDAVTSVTSLPSKTLAAPHIQEAINLRIQKYPGNVRKEQHVAHAYVPVGVAALLREYPTLVSLAVSSFCDRDDMDNKALRVMRHFPPEQRVMTAVRFSRALYARLQASPYTPDRRTGWSLPPPSHKDYKQHSLGVKLACGFELLVCNAGGVTPTTPPAEGISSLGAAEGVTSNPRWGRYKQALTQKGYFRGELEGSKLYKELESNALSYFTQHLLHGQMSPRPGTMDPLTAGAAVIKLLGKVNADIDFFTERQKRLVPADDDSWLKMSPDMLDEMLETRYGKTDEPKAASEENLQSGLEAFLKNSSDFEGAEITDDLQEKLRKLSTMSLPRRKESTLAGRKMSSQERKLSHARKVSQNLSVHPQSRKISNQSTTSNASQMSSFSNKIELNADAFSDAYMNCFEKYFDDDDYFRGSDDESSGLSSYGDEDSSDGEGPERKISSSSTTSGTSSGVEPDIRSVMREMESQLRNTKVGDNMRETPSDLDSDDDEFGDVEDFEPVKVDPSTVQQLVKTYKEERGMPGPASTLFASLGMKPK